MNDYPISLTRPLGGAAVVALFVQHMCNSGTRQRLHLVFAWMHIMAKLPSFQFYPGDWKKDNGVQALGFHDRGVWMELMILMFESTPRGKLMLAGRAMTEDETARIIGLDKQILTTTLDTLLRTGVASRCDETGAIMCRRMVRDEYIRKIRADAGKKGGNPALLKLKDSDLLKLIPTTGVKQNPTPSSSPSSSGASSEQSTAAQSHIPKTKKKTPGVTDEQMKAFWDAWTPRKRVSKKEARMELSRALASGVALSSIVEGAVRYALSTKDSEVEHIMHPHRWLKKERWMDAEPEAAQQKVRFGRWNCPKCRINRDTTSATCSQCGGDLVRGWRE